MDTSELEAACRPVLDLAARLADPEPGDGEAWGPGDVLAHLIVSDRLVGRALRSVLEGAAEPYDNADAITLAELRALAGELGGPDRLAGRLDEARAHLPMHRRQLSELLGLP
jgi:hypothetical protein